MIQGIWLCGMVTLLVVGVTGVIIAYQTPSLVIVPEFASLLGELNIPPWLVITVGLVVPIGASIALGGLVWLGRRDDRLAMLFSLGLMGITLIAARASFAVASSTPSLRPLMNAVDVLTAISIVLFCFLFPSGTFQPKWSRWVAYMLIALSISYPSIVQGMGSVMSGSAPSAWEVAGLVAFAVILAVGTSVAQIVRYRRFATTKERQQIKWVFFNLCVLALMVALVLTLFAVPDSPPPWAAWVVLVAAGVGSLLPLSVGVALFRYHLYDIDRVINRTVVYGIVVIVLLGVYATGVFVLTALLPGDSGIAVAVSTLAAAALLNPLRNRVQELVDRRFYRSRYNAQMVVEQFSTTAQSEVDLRRLTNQFLETVDVVVKPASLAIWVRHRE